MSVVFTADRRVTEDLSVCYETLKSSTFWIITPHTVWSAFSVSQIILVGFMFSSFLSSLPVCFVSVHFSFLVFLSSVILICLFVSLMSPFVLCRFLLLLILSSFYLVSVVLLPRLPHVVSAGLSHFVFVFLFVLISCFQLYLKSVFIATVCLHLYF